MRSVIGRYCQFVNNRILDLKFLTKSEVSERMEAIIVSVPRRLKPGKLYVYDNKRVFHLNCYRINVRITC